jgi:hypothetical protein
MTEVGATFGEETVGIGSAMRKRTRHCRQHLGGEGRVADVTRNAAHRNSIFDAAAFPAWEPHESRGRSINDAGTMQHARREVYPKS